MTDVYFARGSKEQPEKFQMLIRTFPKGSPNQGNNSKIYVKTKFNKTQKWEMT